MFRSLPRSVLLVAFVTLLSLVPSEAARPAATAPSRASTLEDRYRDVAARITGEALSSDHAYERLSELCDGIGHRLSGSEALERAVIWAAAAMREDGLERVQLQPVRVPHWVRNAERAQMVAPVRHELAMLGLGRSIATPPGGVTADVIVVGSFSELDSLPRSAVEGKIVLYDVPFTTYGETVRYRGRGARHAASRGAVAALVRSVGPVSLRTPHTGAMSSYVDSFPRIPAAAVSIEDATMMRRLVERGQRVRVRLEMSAETRPDAISHNVIGEIRGRERPEEVVVIGGHIDSWDVGQGAHDDGGGCVISMEALRLIRKLGLKPRRTLRCVLWTNEENGQKGAQAYADSLGAAITKHVAAIESDGGVERFAGFDFGAFKLDTTIVDTVRSRLAVERAQALKGLIAGLGGVRIGEGGGGADIDPLMKKGVIGIAHRTTRDHYFDWHHTPSDMLDKVDPIELRKNVAAMAIVAFVLADVQEPLVPMLVKRPVTRTR